MEDRHKVRIWDTKEGKYITDIRMPVGSSASLKGSHYLLKIFLGLDGKIYVDWPDDDLDELSPETFIRENCTGLKDKAGKLIFEGNILRVGRGQIGTKLRFTVDAVEWSDGGSGGWEFKSVPLQHRGWSCLEDRLEVIGNIHENPELLKE